MIKNIMFMQTTLQQLQLTSQGRLTDLQHLQAKQYRSVSMSEVISNEKNRCIRQSTHLMLVRKNKFYSGSMKSLVLEFVGRRAQQLYPGTWAVVEPVGIQHYYQMLAELMDRADPPIKDKILTALRPNNVNIISDALCIIVDLCRHNIKKQIYSQRQKKDTSLPTNNQQYFKHTENIKSKPLKRINTEITTISYEQQHRQYLQQKRTEFLEEFRQELVMERLNDKLLELFKLNMGNKEMVQKWYGRVMGTRKQFTVGSCYGDLYTNEEKNQLLSSILQQKKQLDTKVTRMGYPNNKTTPQYLKQFVQTYISSKVNLELLNKNYQHLQGPRINLINEWLPFGSMLNEDNELILKPLEQVKSKSLQKCFSMSTIVQNKLAEVNDDIRFSDNGKGKQMKKFKKDIVDCFSRKKLKELLEVPRISPKKKIQNCTSASNIVLPLINKPSIRQTTEKSEHVETKKDKSTEHKHSLRKIEHKKLSALNQQHKIVSATGNVHGINFINL